MPKKIAPKKVATRNAAWTTYEYNLPTRKILVERFLADVREKKNGLKYDGSNPRLKTKLSRVDGRIDQDKIEELLKEEVKSDNLIEGLKTSGGINQPIIVSHDGTVIEGNRRTYAYRQIDNQLAADETLNDEESEAFRYIPVERLPEDITKEEKLCILSVLHIRGEKKWDSREQWQVIKSMYEGGGVSKDMIVSVLGDDENKIKVGIAALGWYAEYDAFSKEQKADSKAKDEDKLWTYFYKAAGKTRFVADYFKLPGERNKFYKFIHNGQFNDCLNIDRLPVVWMKPDGMRMLEEGKNFRDVIKAVEKDYRDRRQQSVYPEAKKLYNTLKKMKRGEKLSLGTEAGADGLTTLKLLHAELYKILAEAGERGRNELLLG